MGFSVTLQYWYLSTLLEQLIWITNSASDAGYYNRIFGIFLPIFGSVPNVLLGFLMAYSSNKKKDSDEESRPLLMDLIKNPKEIYNSAWRGYLFLFLAAIVFTVFSVIRFAPLLYVTFIIYCIWRMFTFITLYQFVGEHFPPSLFGTAAAAALSVGGLMCFMTYGLNPLTVFTFRGNYIPVNVGVGTLSVIFNFIMVVSSWRLRTSKLSDN